MQCDYFDAGRCRSCTLMGVPYAAQLASKQDRCVAALAEVAPDLVWLPAFAGPESHFRNKAKLVVGGRRGAVTLGILDGAAHGVDLRECGLYEPGLSDSLPRLAEFINAIGLEPYSVPHRRGELKYVILTHSPTGELMIRFVLRSRRHEELLRKHLDRLGQEVPAATVVSINLQPDHKAILEGSVEIALTRTQLLAIPVNDVTLQLRPNSFFQTNTNVAAGLYRQARQWVSLAAPESVWDLYCGVGGFALHCADVLSTIPRDVLGVEVSPDAIDSARLSAAAAFPDELTPRRPRFEVADATRMMAAALAEPELVIVNPPRRGIGPALADWLNRSHVRHLVYSSCNVDSLAKDLRAMPALAVREARLFDMFPQTAHHEVIVRLERSP